MALKDALSAALKSDSLDAVKDQLVGAILEEITNPSGGKDAPPWFYRFIPEKYRPIFAAVQYAVVFLTGVTGGAVGNYATTPDKPAEVVTKVVTPPIDPELKTVKLTLKELIAEARATAEKSKAAAELSAAAADKSEKAATAKRNWTLKTQDGNVIGRGDF